ncbi:hypothetical protein [Methanosarcina horonobensis]|uniref:hypothetical protein n=1 Tax=Methanosarcina horonobensis TaxID=418008 RepID=UPI000ACFBE37|nr:hypothetical protein [Methanosarcina horonobensis]
MLDPSIERLAAMPEEIFQMLEKTDPLRAQIVRDCRKLVEKYSPRSCELPANAPKGVTS